MITLTSNGIPVVTPQAPIYILPGNWPVDVKNALLDSRKPGEFIEIPLPHKATLSYYVWW